ncbi:uncharacterized protein LOC143376260 [Andrena cerasifolii]|uniref:uncharacterized protein LOC143376260 n=1 Tax=Andrena cerasifolii TaxID=2819439 RepID=UPI0040384F56
MSRFLPIVALCAFFFAACTAKPAQVLSDPQSLRPLEQQGLVAAETDNNRGQRSPQFGFPSEGSGPLGRNPEFEGKHRKQHRGPKQCDEFGCAGGFGADPGFYPPPPLPFGGAGEASASASAGSIGFNGGPGADASFASANAGSSEGSFGPRPFGAPFGGGESQANAQSANFNFGPFGSASFSVAEASSAGQQF